MAGTIRTLRTLIEGLDTALDAIPTLEDGAGTGTAAGAAVCGSPGSGRMRAPFRPRSSASRGPPAPPALSKLRLAGGVIPAGALLCRSAGPKSQHSRATSA